MERSREDSRLSLRGFTQFGAHTVDTNSNFKSCRFTGCALLYLSPITGCLKRVTKKSSD